MQLHLGFPRAGNHPRYSAHLNADLFGGLSTSGVLYEPVGAGEFAYPLPNIASVTEIKPDLNLAGRVVFKRRCDCCTDAEGWDFAGCNALSIRGDVLSKTGPNAFVVEASGFSNLTLGAQIVANATGGGGITNVSLSAGADPETEVLIQATINM